MIKRILSIVAGGVLLVSAGQSARAEGIDWSAQGSVLFNLAGGGPGVPIGDTLWMGYFPTGFDFSANTTFAQLTAPGAFTFIDSVQFGHDESDSNNINFGPGQFYGSIGGSFAPGTTYQLYIWAFNNVTPSAATQWAIVTNPTWVGPASGPNFSIIDVSDPGTIVPPGALGSYIGNNIFLQIAPVPEPSTYLLGLVGAGAMIGATRLRRVRAGR